MTEESRTYIRGKTGFSVSGAGKKWTATCERMRLEYSHFTCKNKLKMDIRPEIIKLQEEKTGITLFDINSSNTFLDLSSQEKETKTKINNWYLIKPKSF